MIDVASYFVAQLATRVNRVSHKFASTLVRAATHSRICSLSNAVGTVRWIAGGRITADVLQSRYIF